MTSKAGIVERLTGPQRELLFDIREGSTGVDGGYRPAQKLVSLGLAEWVEGRYSDFLRITEAGRAALAQGE